MLHLQEPLRGERWLNGDTGALRAADLVVVIFNALHQASRFQIFGNLAADIEAVLANVHAGSLGDGCVVVEDVDGFEIVFFSKHVVVDIMGGGDFQASCSKFNVNIFVFDDGNEPGEPSL